MHCGENFGLDMGRQQDGAIGAVAQRLVILGVLADQHAKASRPSPQQLDRLRTVGAAILQANDVRMFGKREQRVVIEMNGGPVGNVVEHDRP